MGSAFKSQLCHHTHNVTSITGPLCNIISYLCPLGLLGLDYTFCFQSMPISTIVSTIASFQRKPITLTYCELCHFTKALWGQEEVLDTQYRPFHLKRIPIRYLLAISSPKSPRKSCQQFSIFPPPFIQLLFHLRTACPFSQPSPPVPFLISQPFFIQSTCAYLNPDTQ